MTQNYIKYSENMKNCSKEKKKYSRKVKTFNKEKIAIKA